MLGIQTLHQDLQNADGQTLLHVVEDIDILKLLVQNCQGKGMTANHSVITVSQKVNQLALFIFVTRPTWRLRLQCPFHGLAPKNSLHRPSLLRTAHSQIPRTCEDHTLPPLLLPLLLFLSMSPKFFCVLGVDHEDVDGITPLMYLFARCQNENRESFNKILEQANFLIKSGADLNHLNKSGWNILHMALITKQGGKQRLPNLVASLIELGIDLKVLTQDKDSFTVLHLALKTGMKFDFFPPFMVRTSRAVLFAWRSPKNLQILNPNQILIFLPCGCVEGLLFVFFGVSQEPHRGWL